MAATPDLDDLNDNLDILNSPNCIQSLLHEFGLDVITTNTVLDGNVGEMQSSLWNNGTDDNNTALVQDRPSGLPIASDLSFANESKAIVSTTSPDALALNKPRRLEWKLPNIVFYGNLLLSNGVKISIRYPKLSALEWEQRILHNLEATVPPRYPSIVQALTYVNPAQVAIANIIPRLQCGGVLLVSNQTTPLQVLKLLKDVNQNVPVQVIDLNVVTSKSLTTIHGLPIRKKFVANGNTTTDNCQDLGTRENLVVQQEAETSNVSGINDQKIEGPGNILVNLLNEPVRFRHQCPSCFQRFMKRTKLKAHWQIHKGETPYACKECRKIFRHSARLPQHCLHPED